MSRPTLLTDELLELAAVTLADSPVLTILSARLGVTDRTVRYWHCWGRKEARRRERGLEPREESTPYVRFFQTIKNAHADHKHRLLAELRAGDSGWTSKAWILERLWFDEFGANAHEIKLLRREVKELRDAVGHADRRPARRPVGEAAARNGHN